MKTEQQLRASGEPEDFTHVKQLMNTVTDSTHDIEPATLELDCTNAIDLVMDGQFFLAVRGRTFTDEYYKRYGDQFTIRCKELTKILFARPRPDALIYLIKNTAGTVLHYRIISLKKFRDYCAANLIRSVEDARKFPEVFDVVDYSHTQNAFIAINFNAIPGIILCQN